MQSHVTLAFQVCCEQQVPWCRGTGAHPGLPRPVHRGPAQQQADRRAQEGAHPASAGPVTTFWQEAQHEKPLAATQGVLCPAVHEKTVKRQAMHICRTCILGRLSADSAEAEVPVPGGQRDGFRDFQLPQDADCGAADAHIPGRSPRIRAGPLRRRGLVCDLICQMW